MGLLTRSAIQDIHLGTRGFALSDFPEELEQQTKFRLVRKIADGGMGSVYEGKQFGVEGFEKQVAVKALTAEIVEDRRFVEMFIAEAKLVADLVHENIAQIYQLGSCGRVYFIVMEYINGKTLREFINRHVQIKSFVPVEVVTFIISRVCRALEYAHSKKDAEGGSLGIVHRDVSPGNVMMTDEGVVKLADFGIAKARDIVNREGEVLFGKAQYMSPEQASFKETDARSDIFSLGVVMFELLTCRRLFDADSESDILEQVTECAFPPFELFRPDASREVRRILSKALQKEPEDRYEDAGQMGYDLEHFMYHDRFGPTNITLARYLKKIFPEEELGLLQTGVDTRLQERTRMDTGGEKVSWSEDPELDP